MFDRKVLGRIWDEVQKNQLVLHGCPGPHDFQPMEERGAFPRVRCSICGGCLDQASAEWYRRGLKHGQAQHG